MLNIRRAKLLDTSTNTTFRSRSRDAIYTSSMSRNRLPGDQNVFRSVLVSVQMLAAVVAFELTDFQTKASVDIPTRVASLAAWKEPVRDSQLPPIPSTFIGQHFSELSKAGATDVLCEAPILHHAAHVQIFDGQYIEAAHQVCRELVEEVLPAIHNPGVQPCHLQPLVIPAATAFNATGENPLQSRQPCGIAGSVARVAESLPGGECCQPRYSQVDPDHVSSLRECGPVWFVQTKTHEVTPGTILCYRNCGWRTCETATPFDSETTDFGNCKVAVGRIPFESVDRVFSGLFSALGAEHWVARPLGEEIRERSLQMPQSLLLWDTGRFTKPGKLCVCAVLGERGTTGVVIDWLAIFEAVCAKTQSEVIDVTGATEFPRQLPRLSLGRIRSECQSYFQLQGSNISC